MEERKVRADRNFLRKGFAAGRRGSGEAQEDAAPRSKGNADAVADSVGPGSGDQRRVPGGEPERGLRQCAGAGGGQAEAGPCPGPPGGWGAADMEGGPPSPLVPPAGIARALPARPSRPWGPRRG